MNGLTSGPAAPETKAFGRMADGHDELMRIFEAFREANDMRLDEIEAKLGADVVTEEKVARIDRALTEQKALIERMALEARRPPVGGAAPREVRGGDAFAAYMRKGDASALETKEDKLSAGTPSEGGYLVPEETERRIDSLLTQASPIRAIASVRQIAGASLRLPISRNGFASGWAAEAGARAQTNVADMTLAEFPAMELYAMPAATQSLLDDALVDVEQWVAEEVQYAFAAQESAAFVDGDGVNKPRGFLDYPQLAESAWSWGNIGFVLSGAAGGFAAAAPADRLIDLAYAPKQTYRQNASWVMNRATEAAVRKLKDAQGAYLWQPGAAAGQPATLLGYPVVEAEDMPDITAGSASIAFGDFRRGYLVADRQGVRVLRDPYSAKPYVLFYTTKRVGGGVRNFEAIKLMKFAAS